MNKIQKIIPILITALSLAGFTAWKRSSNQTPNLKTLADKTNIVPVLVIGSGPTGLSAALFTARAGFKTVVLSGTQLGGHLSEISTIENWPGTPKMKGMSLGTELEKQATQFGAQVLKDNAVDVNLSSWPFTVKTADGLILTPLSIIIATGGEPKRLNVPGINTYWGKGVGVCTICDAPLNKGQKVVVVGGSDTAAERAMQLAPFAEKVVMVVREPALQAAASVQDYLKEYKNITIMLDTQVTSIEGDGNKINNVMVKNNQTNQQQAIPAHALYLSVGFTPRSDLFKKQLKTDSNGYITISRPTHHTSIKGVFAAGIVSDGIYNKASVSSGMGVQAAIDAINFLQEIGYTPTVEQTIAHQIFADSSQKTQVPVIATKEELDVALTKPVVVLQTIHPLCSLCHNNRKTFSTSARDYAQKAYFAQLDISKAADLAHQLGTDQASIILLIKNGKVVKQVKALNSDQIVGFIKENLN